MHRKLIALAGAAGSALLLTSGCAMTVDSYELTNWRQRGFDFAIERRVKRDVTMLADSYNDDYETWAVNRDTRDLCLALLASGSTRVRNTWRVPAGGEMKVFTTSGDRSVYDVHWASMDPTCSRWSTD